MPPSVIKKIIEAAARETTMKDPTPADGPATGVETNMDAADAAGTTRPLGVTGLTPNRAVRRRKADEELLMLFFRWFLGASTTLLLVWNEKFRLHGVARARTLAPEQMGPCTTVNI